MLIVWGGVRPVRFENRGDASAVVGPGPGESLRLHRMVEPVLPGEAHADGVPGTVVAVLVNRQGTPQAIEVVRGKTVLAQAVCDAVRQWRWEPIRLQRLATAVELTIAVNFLDECVPGEGRTEVISAAAIA